LIKTLSQVGKESEFDASALSDLLDAFKNHLKLNDQELNKSIIKPFSGDEIKNAIELNKTFEISVQKSNVILQDLIGTILKSQDAFETFGDELETNLIKRLSNVTTTGRIQDITQQTSNKFSLAKEGGPYLKNFFDFQEELTKNKNELNKGTTSASNNAKNSISGLLDKLREEIIDGANEALNTQSKKGGNQISPKDQLRISKTIEVLQSSFDKDAKPIQDILSGNNDLSDSDLEKIQEALDKKLSLLNKFRQLNPQSPTGISQEANQLFPNIDKDYSYQQYLNLLQGQTGFQSSDLIPLGGILGSPLKSNKFNLNTEQNSARNFIRDTGYSSDTLGFLQESGTAENAQLQIS
jgi:ribosomal protein S17E